MKPILLCFNAVLFAASLCAQDAKPADLKTLSGKVYKQARVFRVEPDGIHYMFAGGMVKIDFMDLPDAIRKQYGYDPAKAAAFAKADAEEQGAASDAVQAAEAEKRARDKEIAIRAAQDVAAIPTPPPVGSLQTLQTGTLGTGSLGDGATLKIPVDGVVIQVTESGLPVSHKDKVVLLQDYPKQDAVVENARCRTIGQPTGSFEYDRADGTTGTIPRYHFLSGTISNPKE